MMPNGIPGRRRTPIMKSFFPTRPPERFELRHIIFWQSVFSALIGATGYFVMMTGFSRWDDEGSLMITVKQYLAGMKIYDAVFSGYGPVYYFYRWVLHSLFTLPITHDAVRITSLIPWVGAALFCAWITLRLTRSLLLAVFAQVYASYVLTFFKNEPGHPQEPAMLLLLALAAAPLFAPLETRRTMLMLALGTLSAGLLLIKINAGAIAIAAVAMSLVSGTRPNRVWRALGITAGIACTAFPLVLMRNHLDLPWARSYCLLVMASVAGSSICMLGRPQIPTVTCRDCLFAVAGFVAAIAAVLLILHGQGVSMYAVYDCLVLAPYRIFAVHRTWYYAPYLLRFTPVWGFVGLSGALFMAWAQPVPGSRAWRFLFAGKATLSVVSLAAVFFGWPLLTVVSPFVWLLMFKPDQANDASQSYPRRLLAILTALQILYAYPIAGSQINFITVLLSTAVAVSLGDTIFWLIESRPAERDFGRWQRAAVSVALAGLAVIQVRELVTRYREYQSMPALDLPGAHLVHVPPPAKTDLAWLVRNLRQQCDSFESLPGLPSLSFWTRIEPLTGINVDAWTVSVSPELQRQIVAAISSHSRACMVYNQTLSDFWNPAHDNLDDLPLVHYIFQNFRSAGRRGDFQIMVKNDRVDTPVLR
jgi:hypothetical protein